VKGRSKEDKQKTIVDTLDSSTENQPIPICPCGTVRKEMRNNGCHVKKEHKVKPQ